MSLLTDWVVPFVATLAGVITGVVFWIRPYWREINRLHDEVDKLTKLHNSHVDHMEAIFRTLGEGLRDVELRRRVLSAVETKTVQEGEWD